MEDVLWSYETSESLDKLPEESRSHLSNTMRDRAASSIFEMLLKCVKCNQMAQVNTLLTMIFSIYDRHIMLPEFKSCLKRVMESLCDKTKCECEIRFAYLTCMKLLTVDTPKDVAKCVFSYLQRRPSLRRITAMRHVCDILKNQIDVMDDDDAKPVEKSVIDILPTIVMALRWHRNHKMFLESSYDLLTHVASRSEDGRCAIISAGGLNAIALARSWPTLEQARFRAIFAINYGSPTPEDELDEWYAAL